MVSVYINRYGCQVSLYSTLSDSRTSLEVHQLAVHQDTRSINYMLCYNGIKVQALIVLLAAHCTSERFAITDAAAAMLHHHRLSLLLLNLFNQLFLTCTIEVFSIG